MKLLAVDTALGACSAAIVEDSKVLATRRELMDRGHAERIAPMAQEVMAEAGLAFAALNRLAVTTGPGTFTGQRVGIAFMRGLRLALRQPLIGVTTLEAMLAAALDESGMDAAAAFHDARREEVYCAVHAKGELAVPVSLARFDDALHLVRAAVGNDKVAFAGTAAEKAASAYAATGGSGFATNVRQPDAVWVARLAVGKPEPAASPHPLYLRAPDAKLPKKTMP